MGSPYSRRLALATPPIDILKSDLELINQKLFIDLSLGHEFTRLQTFAALCDLQFLP